MAYGGEEVELAGRYAKINNSTSARMVEAREERQTQEVIRKRRKDSGKREEED